MAVSLSSGAIAVNDRTNAFKICSMCQAQFKHFFVDLWNKLYSAVAISVAKVATVIVVVRREKGLSAALLNVSAGMVGSADYGFCGHNLPLSIPRFLSHS